MAVLRPLRRSFDHYGGLAAAELLPLLRFYINHNNKKLDVILTGSSTEDAEWKNCQPHTSSDDLEEDSESALQRLLDFPDNNDMSFLGHRDTYSMCTLPF
ncbi:Transcription factor [Datura stramonium]|uniref:Transcription factor n=1 Tax=Datura stramonium TaxID=4076 RepID=A0ABS8UK84_DATST|nr:Transcription factor [Datura stramonium]